jgi:Holliday junction resolvase RusA-like endonuclease
VIQIAVIGIPRPGGGKIGGFNRNTGKGFVRPDNPNTAIWRSDVQGAALRRYSGPLLIGPISMIYEFRFPRPKHHYKANGDLKPNAPSLHINKPDMTKIIRSTEDALTGIVWKDDSQVCKRSELKRYVNPGELPGCTMHIWEV